MKNTELIKKALEKAIRNCDKWIGGAVVVKDSYDYEAIPGAYLRDISYTGPREVVFEIASKDDFGDDVDVESQSDLDFIINEMILPNLDL
jgi:hypothetical protein